MARAANLNISLSPAELKRVHDRVESGDYRSASEVVRESLRLFFREKRSTPRRSAKQLDRRLKAGYRANASLDRQTAQDWAKLADPWPEK